MSDGNSGRTEDADACKRPLLNYQEWGEIEMGLYREDRVRGAMGEQDHEGSVPRWGNWNQIDVEAKWRLAMVKRIELLSPETTGA